jgi:hypothetical protein
MKTFLTLATIAGLLAGCSGNTDVVVTGKAIRSDVNTSAAIPDELGGTAPGMGEIYWVEGQVRNGGEKEAKNVTIVFRCSDGGSQKRLLVATVMSIPPGKTVPFRSERLASQLPFKFTDDEPEITVGR